MENTSTTSPLYELKARNHGVDDLELEIWQLPCSASPHLKKPLRVAGLRGRKLAIVETQVLRRLNKAGIKVTPKVGCEQTFELDEDTSLNIGLLCRLLAPMRSAERMREIALGVDEMEREEAAYCLGMSMHRKNPRRVLGSLRMLLTSP